MTTAEFLAAELTRTREQLNAPILNRQRWDSLRDDQRLLRFLEGRSQAGGFAGLRAELQRLADGVARVPELDAPRRKATDFLVRWAATLDVLDP